MRIACHTQADLQGELCHIDAATADNHCGSDA